MGPVTRVLQQEFQAAIRGKHKRSSEWLDYVKGTAPVEIKLDVMASK